MSQLLKKLKHAMSQTKFKGDARMFFYGTEAGAKNFWKKLKRACKEK